MRRFSLWTLRLAASAAAIGGAAAYGGCGDLVLPPAQPQGDGGDNDATSDANLDADGTAELDAGGGDARATNLDCTGQDAAFGPPTDLGCTGLYANWLKRTISPDAKAFDPGLHMWSDGADALRWIQLPAGQKIDTTDMNEWRFPVGTKVWEEFKLSGHRVETRHFWKRGANDWVRTTYRWSDDERTSISLIDGSQNVGGSTYSIPVVAQCDTCHSGRVDKVLGFDAVSLSSPASKFDGQQPAMNAVAALLTAPPAPALVIPDDTSSKAAPALGWLHANCGTSCHNASASSSAGGNGLYLRLEVGPGGLGAYDQTAAYKTGVCQVARYNNDQPAGGWVRIFPANLTRSLLPFRGGRRNDPQIQMPPFASNVPDLDGIKLVQDWIQTGAFPTQTTPCPQP